MKQDDILYVRVPRDLRSALERERKRVSDTAGVNVTTSALLRAILERALQKKSSRRAA